MHCSQSVFVAVGLGLLAPLVRAAQDAAPAWPQFRGAGGTAVAADTAVPLDFGPESRVLWSAAVPAGHSSPCILGDRVFLTGASGGKLAVLALDRSTGERLWTRELEGEPEGEFGHVASAPAMSTPCTDGERVFAYFGAFGLAAFDLAGEPLWERRLPAPGFSFGVSPSPILAGGRVILVRDGAPESAVLAFDAQSGEPAWSIPRIGFIESHSTPFLWRTERREELVIAGTRRLAAHDPSTGAALWNVDDITLFTCTTPTADADTLYFAGWSTPNASGRPLFDESFGPHIELSDEEVADLGLLFDRLDADDDGRVVLEDVPPSRARDAFHYLDSDGSGAWEREEFVAALNVGSAPGKNVVVAVAAGGEGDVTETHVRWSWQRGLPYVASPLLYRGRLWMFKAGGLVTCLDAESGDRIIDRARLPVGGEYYMSPVGAGGHVLAGSVAGTLFVLNADADELQVVHSVEFEEGLYATPAVLDGVVYLRTPTTMWAFGG